MCVVVGVGVCECLRLEGKNGVGCEMRSGKERPQAPLSLTGTWPKRACFVNACRIGPRFEGDNTVCRHYFVKHFASNNHDVGLSKSDAGALKCVRLYNYKIDTQGLDSSTPDVGCTTRCITMAVQRLELLSQLPFLNCLAGAGGAAKSNSVHTVSRRSRVIGRKTAYNKEGHDLI